MARFKKDIDRELMYKKILPTAMTAENAEKTNRQDAMEETLSQNMSAATLAVSINTPVEVIVSSPVTEDFIPTPSVTQPTPAMSAPAQPEVEAGAFQPGQPDTQTTVMTSEPPLVNLMEAFVEKRLDAAMKKFKCCTCERCRKDVLANTLNKLPSLYVIEDDSDIRDLHERERAAQVATALVQAILAVKAHPSHEIAKKESFI